MDATKNTYSPDAYVAWGVDESVEPRGSRYWIAVWSDEPESAEREAFSESAARSIAEVWASEVGLEAIMCDEFGPVNPA